MSKMNKELKDFIDSVDSANKAQSDLEITIRGLKEDVQRLNFTIDEQKRIIEDQKSKLSNIQSQNFLIFKAIIHLKMFLS